MRTGAGVLAALNLWWGVWPASRRDPSSTAFRARPELDGGLSAVREHLVTDLGSTFLTLAFLLGAVATTTNRAVWRVVLAGVLLFNTLHLGFHAFDAGEFEGADVGASLATLAAGVAIPLGLFAVELLSSRQRRR